MSLREDIQKTYIAYFNRASDAGGMAYWEGQISSGKASLADIAKLFAGTEEYKTLYGASSDEAVVKSVYNNLFGREAEEGGLNYWVAEMGAGRVTIGDVAYQVLNGANNADRSTIENKAKVAEVFTKNLEASDADKSYAGDAIQKVRDWLSEVDDSNTSIDTAVAQVVGLMSDLSGVSVTPHLSTFAIGDVLNPVEDIWKEAFTAHTVENFKFGFDKIHMNDRTGGDLNLPKQIYVYEEKWYGGEPPVKAFEFATFGVLGLGGEQINPVSDVTVPVLNPMMAGDIAIYTFNDLSGAEYTYLFVDNGDPAASAQFSNGIGTATWRGDDDIIVNLTGMTGFTYESGQTFDSSLLFI